MPDGNRQQDDRLEQKAVSLSHTEWELIGVEAAQNILKWAAAGIGTGRCGIEDIINLLRNDYFARLPKEKPKNETPEPFSLTEDQEQALQIMQSGKNCFVSGGAGVGKSFVTREFIKKAQEDGKSVLVCAPTGIAAINVGGSTIHRLFGIRVQADIYTKYDINEIYDKYRKHIEAPDKPANPLFYADILIIDEISMCRGDLFEMVMAALKGIRDNKKHGRSLQLILVGDFFQLPPILKSRPDIAQVVDGKETLISEADRYNAIYGNRTGFSFLSKSWENIEFCVLNKVIRQRNGDFSNALNNVRIGNADGFQWILDNSSPKPLPDAVWISGINKVVDQKNKQALDKINNKLFSFQMGYCPIEMTERELRTEAARVARDILYLKKDARVIALVNKYEEGGECLFANGMYGTVLDIDADNGIVKVRFENGKTVDVKPHQWEITKYGINVVGGKEKTIEQIVGTFTQFPLTLGYAVTVHKAQGQTISRINVDRQTSFANGQLYVALSRCPDVSSMYIERGVRPKTSEDVKMFYQEQIEQEEWE